eukprot:PRCOL_00001453-RA
MRTEADALREVVDDKGEYVWNSGWDDKLQTERAAAKRRAEQAAEDEENARTRGGALRLSNLSVLDSDDLSEELERIRLEKEREKEEAAYHAAQRKIAKEQGRAYQPARDKGWDKSKKYAAMSTAELVQQAKMEAKADEERRIQTREEGQREYEDMKMSLQIVTALSGLALFGITYETYDHNVAYSYGFGSLGSLVYLSLLNKKVDSLARDDAGADSAAPTLLVPLIIFMAYNRWNVLAAPVTGISLQLLPMLLGFFTYKIGTFYQLFVDVERASSSGGSSD